MYLLVFVGLAWLLTAPFMAVLIGKTIAMGDRRQRQDSLFAFLEADLQSRAPRPAAGRN